MAASFLELDSFLIKFKQLWNNGLEANLNLATKAGKTSNLVIDKPPGPVYKPFGNMVTKEDAKMKSIRKNVLYLLWLILKSKLIYLMKKKNWMIVR